MKKLSWTRFIAYKIAKSLYFGGYPSFFSYHLGLQGKINISNISVSLGLREIGLKNINCLFMSDFHFGKLTSNNIFKRIEEIILTNDIDLILLGGDYIFIHKNKFYEMISFLKNFSFPLGKFAVMGNHDRWLLKDNLRDEFEKCDVKLLVNEEATLPAPYSHIRIFGLDDVKYGTPLCDVALKTEEEKRIFLCHSPEGLAFAKDGLFDFALFGHTHGGQIAFNSKKPYLPFKDKYSKTYPKGFYDRKTNGFDFSFYVSVGIGCVWLPIRINSPSELVFIDFY